MVRVLGALPGLAAVAVPLVPALDAPPVSAAVAELRALVLALGAQPWPERRARRRGRSPAKRSARQPEGNDRRKGN